MINDSHRLTVYVASFPLPELATNTTHTHNQPTMKKTLIKSLALAAVAGFLALAPSAQAVFIPSPSFNGAGVNDSDAAMQRLTGIDCLEQLYKDDGQESGDVDLFETDLDAGNSTTVILDYTGTGSFFDMYSHGYIVVKGGSNDPRWVYYSLAGWDGIENIQVTNADLADNNQGKKPGVSHVSVYGCEGTTNVPEGGASVALLGLALGGLGAARRFMVKKA